MAAAKRTKVLFADDTALFNADADGRVEVVTLADHEHVVDAKIERIRELEAIQRGLGRILEARGEDALAAAVRLVEEVEHYREIRHSEQIVDELPVSRTLRQWIREELIHWQQTACGQMDDAELHREEGRIQAFEAALERLDVEEAASS